MSNRAQFYFAAVAAQYIAAGRGRLTIVSVKTGCRFTYQLHKPKPRDDSGAAVPIFVSVLSGPSNEADYTYLGCLWPAYRGEDAPSDAFVYRHGAKSTVKPTAASAKAWAWFTSMLQRRAAANQPFDPKVVEVWHEGSCGRCGRPLTVPKSIALGLGPVCASKGH